MLSGDLFKSGSWVKMCRLNELMQFGPRQGNYFSAGRSPVWGMLWVVPSARGGWTRVCGASMGRARGSWNTISYGHSVSPSRRETAGHRGEKTPVILWWRTQGSMWSSCSGWRSLVKNKRVRNRWGRQFSGGLLQLQLKSRVTAWSPALRQGGFGARWCHRCHTDGTQARWEPLMIFITVSTARTFALGFLLFFSVLTI